METPLLFSNIKHLYGITGPSIGTEGAQIGNEPISLEDAFILVQDGEINAWGAMADCPKAYLQKGKKVDCSGKLVLPGFVDSHTHLVFPKSREGEYRLRIQGASYEEIARQGGGILNSARVTASTSEEELLKAAEKRAWEVLKNGTTTLEIKSGYGLDLESELKLLRVANSLKELVPLRIKTTLLGAHALPPSYASDREKYLDIVCQEMIPQAAEAGLANFVDVFCETGFFTPEETRKVIRTGATYCLQAKIHTNQLSISGGIPVAVEEGALSVDHLESVTDEEINLLQESEVIPVALPTVSFFLGLPYARCREMWDAGLPLALATDYNPGSSPGGSLPFVISLACTRQSLLPEEALKAVTLYAARALGMDKEVGSIEVGKAADLVVTKPMDNLAQIPYYFTQNPVEQVWIGGACAWGNLENS
ncbi:MAG: imidazolonepropionase [Bacteroidota bacterium]